MRRREFITGLTGGLAMGGIGASGAVDAEARTDPLEETEILTDDYGEHHVYADSLYGLGYGNGYVQAGDRLFLMDVVRHIGYGDSAKVLGPAQLPSDIQVKRDLYSRDAISRQWEEAAEPIRETIRGYADGVNRRIVELAAEGELPAEFAALGHAPEPWSPEDTVAAINYLIGYFGVSGGSGLSNARTLARLRDELGSWDAAHEAYGDLNWLRTTDDHYTSIPADDAVVEGGEVAPDVDAVPDDQLAYAAAAPGAEIWGIERDLSLPDAVVEGRREGQGLTAGFKWGSNALVVGSELSETGDPLLGGGPQMGFFKPPIPYEIGLHGAGFDVSGIGVVGAPALVIGRTNGTDGGDDTAGDGRDALAWTVTSGRDDVVDTVAVDLHPDDRHRYLWDGEWYEMETRTVEHVASPVPPALGDDPETRVVEQEVARIEQNGAEMPVVAWNPEENVAWCQRTTTRHDELAGAFIWADLGRAEDLDDVERRLSEFPFTFNFHVASDAGDIAYIHTGRVPDRSAAGDYRLPRTSADHGWNGTFYAQQGTPEGAATVVRNPSRGYVANWNNGPAAGWRAGDAEQNWGSIHRVDTLDHFVRDALGVPAEVPDGRPVRRTAGTIGVDDVTAIVSRAALHDASAQSTVPFMVRAGRRSDDDRLRAMADELASWLDDYCPWHDEESPAPDEPYVPPTGGDDVYVHAGHAVYDETRRELAALVFAELGAEPSDIEWEPAASRHAAPHGTVWDDVTLYDALRGATDHDWLGARRADDVRTALERAAERLEDEFGTPDPAAWLAPVHESRFLPVGAGAVEAVDMRNRASYNQAIDIGRATADDPETWMPAAEDVLPPGNSGHLSAADLARARATGEEPDRLTDQLGLYVRNEYKPHPVSRPQVEQVAVARRTLRTTLQPGPAVEPASDVPVESLSELYEHAPRGGEP